MNAKQILGLIFGVILLVTGVFMTEARANNFKAGANRVEFKSEGERMIGNLYLPANYKPGDKLPAVVVVGAWTTVKEQMAGLYAQKLAEQGYAAFAFDFRYWGESGGSPRQYESPKAKLQDINNALDYLETLPMIDRERIAGLGICFGAGYMVAAVTQESRIKSFATVAAWFHNPAYLEKTFGADGVKWRRDAGLAARTKFEQNKETVFIPAHSATDQRTAMFNVDYYNSTERGAIPTWKNQFAEISWTEWLDFDAMSYASKVKTPALFVHSDNSGIPGTVKEFYNNIPQATQKELFWTDGNHTDFYDKPEYVNKSVQAISKHFKNTVPQKSK
jgi:uncharacterized protein